MSDKCIIFGCTNHKLQGRFIGNLCGPCHDMLASGEPKYGQTFVHEMQTRIADLEVNNNLKADWIEHTINGMGVDAQRITELEWALKDVIVMLDDPTGSEYIRDMRGATIIARAALKGDANED